MKRRQHLGDFAAPAELIYAIIGERQRWAHPAGTILARRRLKQASTVVGLNEHSMEHGLLLPRSKEPDMTQASPGRNDPCPCGRGRKFKYCCLQMFAAEDQRRQRLRDAESAAVPTLFSYALDRWGRRFLDQAWEEFFVWDHVPTDMEHTPEFHTLFFPWFVFSFVPDPVSSDPIPDAPHEPVALVYLAAASARLSEFERRFVRTAVASPFSFYAVMGTAPGRYIDLRDVISNHDVRVLERSASQMVEPGALLYGHVVTLDDASIMLGVSPLAIPPVWRIPILDIRKRMSRRPSRGRSSSDWNLELRALYHRIAFDLRNPRPPVLTNTDGDPFALTTLEFELRCSVQDAYDGLRSLTLGTADDGLPEDCETGPDGELRRVALSWAKRGNRMHKSWDNTILGTITLAEGQLTAKVNSKRRADRLRREVATRLGARVVFTGSSVQDIEVLRKKRRPQAARTSEFESDDELVELNRAMAEQAWDAWIDQRVPALNHKTPRQAAKTQDGRERLEALFAEFTWRATRQPVDQQVDLAALRRKLGM